MLEQLKFSYIGLLCFVHEQGRHAYSQDVWAMYISIHMYLKQHMPLFYISKTLVHYKINEYEVLLLIIQMDVQQKLQL